MNKPIPKIAILHSLCGVGKASLTNMIPILSSMGIEVCPIPTAILSTHTGGYGMPAIQPVSGEFICECARHYCENQVSLDAIFVGYLGKSELVDAVSYFIEQFPNTKVYLDPIMGDHGNYYGNLDASYCESYQKLIAQADVLLPNLTEACLLTNHPFQQEFPIETLQDIAEQLQKGKQKELVITSIANRIFWSNGQSHGFYEFEKQSGNFHGTGDIFDAVFVGKRMQGYDVQDAVEEAHRFTSACIAKTSNYDYEEREGILIEKMLDQLV